MKLSAGARFALVSQDEAQITIRDLGPWDRHMTVTNDAEGVVKHLAFEGLKDSQRLFYYDSEGRLDELLHKGGKFLGFAPGPGRD